jgi:hypothetical protein
MSSFAIALASIAPRLESHIDVKTISQKLTKIELRATNRGYLPTYVSAVSRPQPWNHELRVRIRVTGCTLVSGLASTDIGHLRGWGRGADEEANAPFFQKSQAIEDIDLTWVVEAPAASRSRLASPG